MHSAAVLRFFFSKICATFSSSGSPSTTFSQFCAQLEAHINDKLRVISYNRAYIEYRCGRNCHSFFFSSTSKLTVIMRTLDPPHFYCGRQHLSYYCHVTLIGFRFRQVHSSFATFVVVRTQRGHTIMTLLNTIEEWQ